MHLVGLRLEPLEEAPDAVPLLVPVASPFRTALDDPLPVRFGQVFPGDIHGYALQLGVPRQIGLAFLEALSLPRLHRAALKRACAIGNHQSQIDADHSAKAAAGFARTDG